MCLPVGLGAFKNCLRGGVGFVANCFFAGSIVAAIAVSVLMIVLGQPLPYQLFAGAAGFVYARFYATVLILGILAGTEPQIG
jgi:glycerol-3-phosphate acyltransferase PlsY